MKGLGNTIFGLLLAALVIMTVKPYLDAVFAQAKAPFAQAVSP